MRTHIIVVAILLARPAAAEPCPPPLPGETALSAAAASLAAGTYCELALNISLADLIAVSGNDEPPVQWADSAAWDPIGRQIHFVGRDAGCGATTIPYVHMTFDDDTSEWSMRADADLFPCGHAYDSNTADPVTGTFYFRRFSDGFVNIRDGDSWLATPTIGDNNSTSPAVGMTYFPELQLPGSLELGGLVIAVGPSVYVLPRNDDVWQEFVLPTPIGNLATMVEYNPITHTVLMGGGNDFTTTLHLMDASGNMSSLPPAPVDIWTNGTEGSLVAADPVSGQFVVFVFNRKQSSWWTMTEAGGWQPIDHDMPTLTGYSFQAPLSNYGVITYFDALLPAMYVYKPATSVVSGEGEGEGAEGEGEGAEGEGEGAEGEGDGAEGEGEGTAQPVGSVGCTCSTSTSSSWAWMLSMLCCLSLRRRL
jgi:hypothetical protein